MSVILVDMDGVLADFDKHLWREFTAVFNDNPFDIASPAEQRHRFLTDHLKGDKQKIRLMRSMVESEGFFAELEVIEGAQEGMAKLDELADEVWICSKPLEASATCPSEKFAWIKEHFPQFVGRLILAPDKSLVLGGVLLDDAPKRSWIGQSYWTPVLYDHPWNGPSSKWGGIQHHFTWADDPQQIIDIARGHA